MTDPEKQYEITLKRVAEVSATATKVGFLGLITLAIIWSSEVKPAYDTLLREGYNQATQSFRTTARRFNEQPQAGLVPSEAEARQANSKRAELLRKVDFEIAGVKVPVPALWSSVALSGLLVGTLMSLGASRRKVWSLLGTSHRVLQTLGRPLTEDDDAGSAPLWLAPAAAHPSADPLRWQQIRPLPNIFVCLALALLVLLQLDVVGTSCRVLSRAAASQVMIERLGVPASAIGDFGELLLPPWGAATLAAVLLLLMLATLLLAIRWMWPVNPTDPLPGRSEVYAQAAAAVTGLLILTGVAALVAHREPEWLLDHEVQIAGWMLAVRPPMIVIVAAIAAVVTIWLATGIVRVPRFRPALGGGSIDVEPIGTLLHPRRVVLTAALTVCALGALFVAVRRLPAAAIHVQQRVRRRARRVGTAALSWALAGGRDRGFYELRHRDLSGNRTDRASKTTPRVYYVTDVLTRRGGIANEGRQPSSSPDAALRVAFATIGEKSVGRLQAVPTPKDRSPASQLFPGAVNPRRTSVVFELAALDALQGNRPADEAAAYLVEGIRRDLAFKRTTRDGPSMRLFDLLARLIARHHLAAYQPIFEKLGDEARLVIELQSNRSRLAKRSKNGKHAERIKRGQQARGVSARRDRLDAFDRRRARWRAIRADQPKPWTAVRPADVMNGERLDTTKITVMV